MSKVTLFWFAAAVAVLATPAFGDDDPALFQDGSHCAGTYWCISTGRAIDPNTGEATLEFILKTSVGGSQGITEPFDTGWAETVTGATIDNLLDFEIIGGKDVIFLYCGNATCNAADVGLPATLPANPVLFAYGNTYTPNAGQPGYASSYSSQGAQPTVPGYAVVNAGPYVNGKGVIAPEPSSIVLLGCMLLMTPGVFRRYSRQ
jgi:hypothetical protein